MCQNIKPLSVTYHGYFQDLKVSAQNIQREARSNQRRLATAFGDLDTGELLKFNQLKVSYLHQQVRVVYLKD